MPYTNYEPVCTLKNFTVTRTQIPKSWRWNAWPLQEITALCYPRPAGNHVSSTHPGWHHHTVAKELKQTQRDLVQCPLFCGQKAPCQGFRELPKVTQQLEAELEQRPWLLPFPSFIQSPLHILLSQHLAWKSCPQTLPQGLGTVLSFAASSYCCSQL